MTRSGKKMVWLSAILALPPLALTTAIIGHPTHGSTSVPAVAAYNEPPAEAAHQRTAGFAQLFAALRSDRGR